MLEIYSSVRQNRDYGRVSLAPRSKDSTTPLRYSGFCEGYCSLARMDTCVISSLVFEDIQINSTARITKCLEGPSHEDLLVDMQMRYRLFPWLRFNIQTSLYQSLETSKRRLLGQT